MPPIKCNIANDSLFTLNFTEAFDHAEPSAMTLTFLEPFEHIENPPAYLLSFNEEFDS